MKRCFTVLSVYVKLTSICFQSGSQEDNWPGQIEGQSYQIICVHGLNVHMIKNMTILLTWPRFRLFLLFKYDLEVLQYCKFDWFRTWLLLTWPQSRLSCCSSMTLTEVVQHMYLIDWLIDFIIVTLYIHYTFINFTVQKIYFRGLFVTLNMELIYMWLVMW